MVALCAYSLHIPRCSILPRDHLKGRWPTTALNGIFLIVKKDQKIAKGLQEEGMTGCTKSDLIDLALKSPDLKDQNKRSIKTNLITLKSSLQSSEVQNEIYKDAGNSDKYLFLEIK